MPHFLIKYGGHPYSLEYGGRHANLALLSLEEVLEKLTSGTFVKRLVD